MRIIYSTLLLFFSTYTIAQTADFTYAAPDGLCSSLTINFTQTCTGTPQGFIWDFGNNNQSVSSNPTFTYAQAGTYKITLTAVYASTESTVSKIIIIDTAGTIKITEDKNFICNPGIINFKAAGRANAISYDWNAGDGSSDIITAVNTLPYNFTAFGNYTVSVKAMQSSGCIDTASTTVSVMNAPLSVTILPSSGCVPVKAEAVATVTVPGGDKVTGYQWDFGDGTAVVNTVIDSTAHTYSTSGVFQPVLKITTAGGCVSIDSIASVGYGVPPKSINASVLQDSVCGSDSMLLLFKSPSASGYLLVWGDGTKDFSSVPGVTSYAHKYESLGTQTIRVIPFDLGCSGKGVTINVFVKGVIASYNFSNNCTNSNVFHFNNSSLGNPSSIAWYFGDGNSVADNYNPTHHYNSFDSFAVNMSIADSVSGCKDSAVKTIYVSHPSLTDTDIAVCKGASTVFILTNNFGSPAATYLWNVAGKIYGPYDSAFSSLSIVADSVGIFNNYVVIDNGAGYCPDTAEEINTLTVRGALLSFNIPDSFCLGTTIQAVNVSPLFSGNDSVQKWNWDFGAGGNNDTAYQPQTYTYLNAGIYNVALSAIDQYGCADTLVKPVTVNQLPFLQVMPAADSICLGQNKTLIAFHSGTLVWSAANGISCNTCDTTLTAPFSSENIIAAATSKFGCISKDTISVKVFTPFTASALFTDSAVCVNDSIQLSVGPADKNIVWSPAAGLSSTNIFNPVAYPNQTTIYTAVLSDSSGCFNDTVHVNVVIKSLPTVDAGPSAVYPYHTNFSFQPTYSADVSAYLWSPSTSLNCSNCAIPQGTADETQTYTVTATSDSGCVAKDTVTIFVACAGSDLLMPTAFTPNNDGVNDSYYPLGRGIKLIKRFAIYNRFGDLVFEKENFPPNEKSYGWKGKYHSLDQPTGTYVFVVQSVCDMGQEVNQQGTFVLIR
jgi:gliding motility-associated-like protein